MTTWWTIVACLGLGQNFAPPPTKVPDERILQVLEQRVRKLSQAAAALQRQGVRDPGLADIEVYLQGVQRLLEHKEFFHADSARWADEALDRGLLRAKFLASGEMPWLIPAGGTVVFGYRSRVDGSVQPYAVTYPFSFGKIPGKRWRVDVVLHGRDTTLTEVKFFNAHKGDKVAGDADYVKIDIFGRGNNAYRWAGETDVFEAVDSFFHREALGGRDKLPDLSRVVLRGFSMGGAGTWHLGLHWPDRWCCMGPGAGFTTTRGYVPKLPEKLPPYQEACLHIYDAVDYAANAFNIPVVAYSGEEDAQMQAAVNIEKRLKALGIPMTHLVAPKLGHKFPPEWQKKADAFWSKYAEQGSPEYPPKVRFVTYTLKYPGAYWVEILGMERHYARASVDAERVGDGFKVKTENVRILHLTLPHGSQLSQPVDIDGARVSARPRVTSTGTYHVYLEKREGKWHDVMPQRVFVQRQQKPQKHQGLQGPIDDAFAEGFLCVRGTEAPWHEATQKYAEKNLERFQAEFSKYLRGQVPVKADVDVTAEEIAGKHLILFGDPASNTLIAQVLDGLPLAWNRETITFAGKTYAAGQHVPVLIYPNPLNANRYVVLNSGHTFHAADFRGTNALLYPRLGDYAILRLTGSEQDPLAVDVMHAGLFDDFWKVD